ncbi:MAG: ABC transporter substrate-binding protein [Holophaga sp.]|jgi:branched-chain amino acid transport system substrate-binding protein
MKTNYSTLIPLAAALCAVFTACGKKNDTIKIGQAVALTGDSSTWGQSEKNALDMEIAKINEKGGVLGKKIELISYDTRADATEGVNVTKRLVSDGVCAIIGPGQSGVAIAMTAVTEPAGVPFLATTATNPKVTIDDKTKQVRHTAFRTCFIDPFQGTVAAQFAAKNLKLKTAAIIYDVGSDYSSFLGKYFTDEFVKQGCKVQASEAFRSGELDFRAILGKVKPAKPDLLFIPTMQKEAALIMKQARDLGMKSVCMGGDGWASPDLITLGGAATEGSYFVNITSLEDPDIQGFLKDYRAKYNNDPVMPNPVMAIDALDVVLDAITKTGGTDPAKLTVQIEQTKNLPTLSGVFSFDPATHNPLNKPAIIQQVKDGKFIYVTKFVTQ